MAAPMTRFLRLSLEAARVKKSSSLLEVMVEVCWESTTAWLEVPTWALFVWCSTAIPCPFKHLLTWKANSVPSCVAFQSSQRYLFPPQGFCFSSFDCRHFDWLTLHWEQQQRQPQQQHEMGEGWRWLESERERKSVCVYVCIYICLLLSSPLENSAVDREAARGSLCQIIWPSTENQFIQLPSLSLPHAKPFPQTPEEKIWLSCPRCKK